MEYQLKKSKRKTMVLTLDPQGNVIVKAPLYLDTKTIESFLKRNENWIKTQQQKQAVAKEQYKPLSQTEIQTLKDQAKILVAQKVQHYANRMQVVPASIKITGAKTRWGSCSYKNNLCFSYRVMLLEDSCIDYIVVHELAHIKQKNHSKLFYQEIEKILPDYKIRIQKIKQFHATDVL